MRISDWSSDVCSSDLGEGFAASSHGNDVIDCGYGENLLASDAMASNAQGGNATTNSTADLTASVSGESNSAGYLTAGAHAGSDIIVGGNDNDIMSGDALAAGEGSIALANNTADGDVTEGQYGEIGRAHV